MSFFGDKCTKAYILIPGGEPRFVNVATRWPHILNDQLSSEKKQITLSTGDAGDNLWLV